MVLETLAGIRHAHAPSRPLTLAVERLSDAYPLAVAAERTPGSRAVTQVIEELDHGADDLRRGVRELDRAGMMDAPLRATIVHAEERLRSAAQLVGRERGHVQAPGLPSTLVASAAEVRSAVVELAERGMGTGIAPVEQAIAGARLPGSRSQRELDQLEHVLEHGRPVPGSAQPVAGTGVGRNQTGELYGMQLVDGSGHRAAAVEKPRTAYPHQERLMWLMARKLGVDDVFAAVGRPRQDGSVAIERLPGTTLSELGVRDRQHLQRLAEQAVGRAHPRLDGFAHHKLARLKLQVAEVVDYLISNHDRRPDNVMFDATRGFGFIDGGMAGNGERLDPLRPILDDTYLGVGADRMLLDAETVRYVAARLDPDDLERLRRDAFAGASSEGLPDVQAGMLEFWSDGKLVSRRMRERLAHVLERGEIAWTPKPPRHDPAWRQPTGTAQATARMT